MCIQRHRHDTTRRMWHTTPVQVTHPIPPIPSYPILSTAVDTRRREQELMSKGLRRPPATLSHPLSLRSKRPARSGSRNLRLVPEHTQQRSDCKEYCLTLSACSMSHASPHVSQRHSQRVCRQHTVTSLSSPLPNEPPMAVTLVPRSRLPTALHSYLPRGLTAHAI